MGWIVLVWPRLNWAELNSPQLDWDLLAELNPAGLGLFELDWAELNWNRLS